MHEQLLTKISTPDDFTEAIPGTGIFASYTRGLIWQANSKSVDLHLETIYGQLCNDQSPYQRLIQRDVTRTFPSIDMYKQENGPGQMAMYRILVSYSLYDAQVGYCQGLAFLVGPLLMNMPEPQAFCVFVRLMEIYGMRSMFTLKMEGLQLRLYQFSCLLKIYLPNLATHLDKHSVHPAMYASQWFLTIFAYVFPMDLVAKIYDMLFVEGAVETIMRVAIAMLKTSEHIILLENEFEDLLDCVATRKLCTPYGEIWSDVISDAMALSDKITRHTLDQLALRYEKENQRLNNNRLGKFWRRRKTSRKTKKPTIDTSLCDNSITDDGQGDNSNNSDEMDVTKLNPSTNEATSVSNPSSMTTSTTLSSNIPNQDLMDTLTQLQREHTRTIDELLETRMDKVDVENERDALKITIMELERRHHESQPIVKHSLSDTTLGNVYDDDNDDQQLHTPYGGKSRSKIIPCNNNNSDMASIRGHKKSLSLSSSASTLINFAPDSTSPPPSMKKSHSVETLSLLSTTTSSWSVPYDTQLRQHQPRMVNNHIRTYSGDSDIGGTNDDLIVDDALISSTDERDALRTELVRAKVAHFESQQHCERLEQEILDFQSRLDMMNEGQMALMEKLVKVTSEMDDVLQDKQRCDEKRIELMQQNSQLTAQLEQQQQQQQHSQEPASLSASYLKAKIYHLETTLAATKTQLANLESSSDHQHPTDTLKARERLEITTYQQDEDTNNTTRLQFDDDEPTNDPLSEARTVGNGRIGRSVTLYGRMWHVISPRAQTIGSS